jgi:hypothetical protein
MFVLFVVEVQRRRRGAPGRDHRPPHRSVGTQQARNLLMVWGAKSGTHSPSCSAARPLGGGGASAICVGPTPAYPWATVVGGGGGADGEHSRVLYCAELRRTAVDCFVRRSRFAGQRGDAGQTGCGVLVHTKVSASIDEQSKRMSLSSSGRMRCDLR